MKIQARLRLLLTAMSFDQKASVAFLRSLDTALTTHCMYLYLYPDAQARNHWAKELAGYSQGIFNHTRLRKNRKLSKALFLDILYEDPMGELQDYEANYRGCYKHMDSVAPTNATASYDDFRPRYKAFVELLYSDVLSSSEVAAFWTNNRRK